MKILVTGMAGFIGFHTSKKLAELGHEVLGIDNINAYYDVDLKLARLAELGIERESALIFGKRVDSSRSEPISFIRMNIEDRENIPQLFKEERFDAVIHLAAQPGVRYSLENPEVYIDTNIVGFLNILEGCRHYQIKHLVYASSSSVYGANTKIPFEETDRVDYPVSLYAATKKANELMAFTYSHLYGFPVTGLRFFTVYGPWGRPDMAPMLFADAIMNDRPIKVFNNGEMYRDFTYIDDIVNGIIIALNHPLAGKRGFEGTGAEAGYQVFNIGNGSPVHLMTFIEEMENALGKKAGKEMQGMQKGDVPKTWANTEKLQALGYSSKTTIGAGVRRFVEWFEERAANDSAKGEL